MGVGVAVSAAPIIGLIEMGTTVGTASVLSVGVGPWGALFVRRFTEYNALVGHPE